MASKKTQAQRFLEDVQEVFVGRLRDEQSTARLGYEGDLPVRRVRATRNGVRVMMRDRSVLTISLSAS